MIFLLMNVNG